MGSSHFGFYTHAGFLKGLVEAGIRPAHIAGASSGAIVGGLYGSGHSPDHVIERLLSFDFMSAFFEPTMAFRGFAMMANLPGISGLLSGRKIIRRVEKIVGERRIEDLRAPRLSIAATNLTRGCSEILDEGPLARSIVASAAVPMLFSAIELGGSYYWDAGVAMCLPFARLLAEPAIHTIIVHQVSHSREVRAWRKRGAPSVATAFNLAHQVMSRRILDLDREKLALSGRRLIFCQTTTAVPPALSRKRRERYVRAGLLTAQSHAADWESLRA